MRRGTDVIKALALGARAVLVGRPVLWGLAAGRPRRASRTALGLLRRELDLAMALCGCADVVADHARPRGAAVIAGTIIGTAVIVALTVAIGVIADRKLGLVPRAELVAAPRPRLPGHAAGEAPATAIRARPAQLARLRTTQRCKECRAALETVAPDDAVRFGDHALAVLHLGCPACGRQRALYVEPMS